jgi:hypothetical protein
VRLKENRTVLFSTPYRQQTNPIKKLIPSP